MGTLDKLKARIGAPQKGKIKRDSIRINRIFSNTINPNIYSDADNSPEAIARRKKFEKENNFEGWEAMKKLEGKQDKANSIGRPTQRTSDQQRALTNAWNYTNIYNKKYKQK
ncbi:hypothetical protein DRO61_09240 [Candidatus Bathyarchaeota archaeon]|nr:MAG: hypothetical protein DRO61_09240 [Candidatus Bathyarchaeota archaeon]